MFRTTLQFSNNKQFGFCFSMGLTLKRNMTKETSAKGPHTALETEKETKVIPGRKNWTISRFLFWKKRAFDTYVTWMPAARSRASSVWSMKTSMQWIASESCQTGRINLTLVGLKPQQYFEGDGCCRSKLKEPSKTEFAGMTTWIMTVFANRQCSWCYQDHNWSHVVLSVSIKSSVYQSPSVCVRKITSPFSHADEWHRGSSFDQHFCDLCNFVCQF